MSASQAGEPHGLVLSAWGWLATASCRPRVTPTLLLGGLRTWVTLWCCCGGAGRLPLEGVRGLGPWGWQDSPAQPSPAGPGLEAQVAVAGLPRELVAWAGCLQRGRQCHTPAGRPDRGAWRAVTGAPRSAHRGLRPRPRRWSQIYFVLWWLVSSVIWVNLFLAVVLEVLEVPTQVVVVSSASVTAGQLGPGLPGSVGGACWAGAGLGAGSAPFTAWVLLALAAGLPWDTPDVGRWRFPGCGWGWGRAPAFAMAGVTVLLPMSRHPG